MATPLSAMARDVIAAVPSCRLVTHPAWTFACEGA